MKQLQIGLASTIAALCLLIYSSFAHAACEVSLPSQGLRDDMLIVVNDNSLDSCEVATHYAQERGLGSKNIVHVKTPAGFFMDWTQFVILRDQIIDRMQQMVKDDDQTFVPVQCSDTVSTYYCQQSMDQLRDRTKIRYLVTTRGVPTRVKVDSSTLSSPSAPTSVDNYLKYWLINYFSSDTRFSSYSLNRARAFGDGRGMREINPHDDQELIVSRLDGLSLESANQLVDRAILAEKAGIYGKLYGNANQYTMKLFDYSNNSDIYGTPSTSWQWQFELFHETDPDCFDYSLPGNYLNFPHWVPEGKSPEKCSVRLNKGVTVTDDLPPGQTLSREPRPWNGLVYFGKLDWQRTTGTFNEFLNWRRDSTCTNTLCSNLPPVDAATCRQASIDIFQEIDTRCVGVSDGFVGFNFQSFPLSYLHVAPTDWWLPSSEGGDGDLYQIALPVIRTDNGFNDLSSLWFFNPDQISTPKCYASSTFNGPPTVDCPDRKIIMIEQPITLPPPARKTVSGNPDRYRVRLHYSSSSVSNPTMLNASIVIYANNNNTGSNLWFGPIPLNSQPISGDLPWSPGEAILTIDPNIYPSWDGNYSRIDFRISTDYNSAFAGAIGIDAVSVKIIDPNGNEISSELIQNGSFAEGHRQVSTGDHAANFLSRLNGAAFWGSVSHHESGGFSFSNHPVETLTYFLRGLPLGDAVWFAEQCNSGLLYGDPLYSPVAVHLSPVEPVLLGQKITLMGSAQNGIDLSQVDTQYVVEYCAGDDFFVCEQQKSWKSTGITGIGGQRDVVLGSWDTASISPSQAGVYVLRLSVTSTNKQTGSQQTFSDSSKVWIYTDWGTAFSDLSNSVVPSTCPNKQIINVRTKIGYDSLDLAVSEASSGDTIKIQNRVVLPNENIILGKNLTIDGGYDCYFTNKIGLMTSVIQGQVNIQNNAATLSNILVDSPSSSFLSKIITLTGTQQTGNSVTLTGTMRTGYGIALSGNTSAAIGPVTYPTATSWSCTISGLVTGNNVFTITATSPTGTQTQISTSVYYSIGSPSPVPAMGPFSLLASCSILLFITRKNRINRHN